MWSTQNYNNTSPHKLTSADPNCRKISILPIFTTIQGYSTIGGSGQHIHAHADMGKDKKLGTEGATCMCTLSMCSSQSSTFVASESVGKATPTHIYAYQNALNFFFNPFQYFIHNIPNTKAHETTHMCPQETHVDHMYMCMQVATCTYGKNHIVHVHVAPACMHSTCTCLASSLRLPPDQSPRDLGNYSKFQSADSAIIV